MWERKREWLQSFNGYADSSEEIEYEVEVQDNVLEPKAEIRKHKHGVGIDPYSDEPLASKQWIKNYEEEEKKEAALLEEFKKRLSGEHPTSDWYVMYNYMIKIQSSHEKLHKHFIVLIYSCSVKQHEFCTLW